MEILHTLEELNELIDSSTRVPFTNKRLVSDDDVKLLIATLKKDCPSAVTDAETVIKEKEAILEAAREEAEKIIHRAKDYAKSLVEEEQIMKEAKQEREMMLRKAQEDVAKAEQQGNKLRQQATEYAQQILKATHGKLEQSKKELDKLQNAIIQAHDSLENYRPDEKQGEEVAAEA